MLGVGRLLCIAQLPPSTSYRVWTISLTGFLRRSSRLACLNLGVMNVDTSMWVRRWIKMPQWRCPVPFGMSQDVSLALQ